MSFGRNTPLTKKNRPISAKALEIAAANADSAIRLRVGAGMMQQGLNGINQLSLVLPGPVYHALTTSSVTARSGTTMGSGTFQLYLDNGATTGVMLVSAGLPDQTGYSISGTAWNTNVWCLVCRVNDRWKFITADCSGAS
jgi:predicted membrane protein